MNCLICNKSEKVKFLNDYNLEIKEHASFFKSAKIYQCTDCDFSFTNPMPKTEDIIFFLMQSLCLHHHNQNHKNF